MGIRKPEQEPIVAEVQLDRDEVSNFERYPFSIPAIRTLGTLPLHPSVTFFVGENGSGKSTLLEAIAVQVGVNAEGGSKHLNFTTRPSHSSLFRHLTLVRSVHRCSDAFFLRAESLYNVATAIDELPDDGVPPHKYYGGRSLHEQSHGESFLNLMMHRFGSSSLLMLDEPEAALSTQRQLAFVRLMHQLVKQHAQFIIATHSPIILAYPQATIYEFAEDGIRRIPYDQTDAYQITRAFLERTDQMLQAILSDDESEEG